MDSAATGNRNPSIDRRRTVPPGHDSPRGGRKATLLRGILAMMAAAGAVMSAPHAHGGGEAVDRTRAADPAGIVEVEIVTGSLEVSGWNRPEVRVEGTLGRGSRGLEFEGENGRTSISVEVDHDEGAEGTDLAIRIPAGSRLKVRVIDADVIVTGIDGGVDIETIAGDIDLDRNGARSLRLNTVSGDIHVVTQVKLAEGFFKTVVGDIDVEADIDTRGKFHLEAVSGDITLALPGRVSAAFDVSTFSGEIDSALGGRVSRRGEHHPGRELKFATGGGGARVRMTTLSGSIDITTR